MSTLLPFHKSILAKIIDPATSDLLILSRGLGLRRLICSFCKLCDSPESLVLLVGASQEEEAEIGEELGIMGCRRPGLRIVTFEMNTKARHELYRGGGLISATSQILIADFLQSNIPAELITGIVLLHAERIKPTCQEAFVVTLYRDKNKSGFLKAFTDQPEHITSGLQPLKNIMKDLQLRSVHIYPRFHEDIKQSLQRRRADVIEISQTMTDAMSDIHQAIIQCMAGTLSELKRTNTSLDLDDFNVDNAYFRSFDQIVRRQLDSVWHKVGPKTKQLVNDLSTLRKLLHYLMTYDPLEFNRYLDLILESESVSASGGPKQHHSQWLLSDAANIIFQSAKRRCFTLSSKSARVAVDEDEDAWEALDELESQQHQPKAKWIPRGLEPVLEELPKWAMLAEILMEIEGEMMRLESISAEGPGSNTVLVMTSDTRSCMLVSEYLSTMDDKAPKGRQGRKMMLKKLRKYLRWKGKLDEQKRQQQQAAKAPAPPNKAISDAMMKKDAERAQRSAMRRRLRGGAPAASTSSLHSNQPTDDPTTLLPNLISMDDNEDDVIEILDVAISEYNETYGLLPPSQVVLVRPYGMDADDRMLAEIQPRFIIMLEPNMDFIRRIEVYRSSNPGLNVRLYHVVYGNSCEEHKYLATIRKEKESFERLIRERGTMILPIFEDKRSNDVIQTISSRIAGGRKEISTEPPTVIMDVRELRAALPVMLHAAGFRLLAPTLTVGDYILTPDICVERKSIPDLVSSFNSGRLYTQCELMSTHYSQPVLLIEFEEEKSFTLDIVSDLKSHGKQPGPKKPMENQTTFNPTVSLQSKLVLLVLNFPRLRIIWSSSPHQTAQIFRDLKLNFPQPDLTKATSLGAGVETGSINTVAGELLRCIPGVTAGNVDTIMSEAGSVRGLCQMSKDKMKGMMGGESAKRCWEFVHRGERKEASKH